MHVSAAIRACIKATIFERLRNSDNATLTVAQLLDKCAGIFMGWLDGSGEAGLTASSVAGRELNLRCQRWSMTNQVASCSVAAGQVAQAI
jgi:hypothetical protein